MANFTGLAAARHRVLRDAGWDVEARRSARVRRACASIVGEERHATIDVALRLPRLRPRRPSSSSPSTTQGRMRADALRATLAAADRGPTIVCAQAGNVNSGAFDPLDEICRGRARARRVGARRRRVRAVGRGDAATSRAPRRGVERADSWATDAHKWLNVPYDCGIVICRDADAHRGAMTAHAAYLVQGGEGAPHDPFDWVPEFSRRGRGIPVYAVIARARTRRDRRANLEQLRDGRRASRRGSAAEPDVELLNDVVLNQVLVRFGDSDDRTRAVVDGVQRDGTCWLSGTVWHGVAAMRISVSNWTTTEADVDASVDAILAHLHKEV